MFLALVRDAESSENARGYCVREPKLASWGRRLRELDGQVVEVDLRQRRLVAAQGVGERRVDVLRYVECEGGLIAVAASVSFRRVHRWGIARTGIRLRLASSRER